jgi:hypothetical protein
MTDTGTCSQGHLREMQQRRSKCTLYGIRILSSVVPHSKFPFVVQNPRDIFEILFAFPPFYFHSHGPGSPTLIPIDI